MTADRQPIDGPWADGVAEVFTAMDPDGAAALLRVSNDPRQGNVLPRRFVELVSVAFNLAVKSRDTDATWRHMRAALAAGATDAELLRRR